MGMGNTGISWDSHGNGNTISRGIGMGIRRIGMGIKTCEWEKVKRFQRIFAHSTRCKISHARLYSSIAILHDFELTFNS